MFRGGTAGSYSNCIFSFLRNLHAVFHSGHIRLHSRWTFIASQMQAMLLVPDILQADFLVPTSAYALST